VSIVVRWNAPFAVVVAAHGRRTVRPWAPTLTWYR
jgi:hypothetical protein